MLATPEAVEAARPAAERLRLTLSEPRPQMILDPLEGTPTSLPPGVTLSLAEDMETVRTLWAVAAQSFGMPLEAFDPLLKDDAALSRYLATPDLTNYLASVDGRPVATAIRFTSHRIAGIYTVCTLPEYRKRGIGGAITLRTAQDGAGEGCTISGLQSSTIGFPVYERIGYRHAFSYTQWETSGGPPQ
jgi:GNAT superfamily N-acetyltransferase